MKRNLVDLFIQYYYEILFLIINLWLGVLLITVGHPFIALAVLLLVVFKSVSIIFNHGRAKVFLLTVMNTMWAFNIFYFLLGHHPVDLPFQFPLMIFFLGVGIALRGRYDE